ncbi:MAG: hypothetical protein WCI27_06960 [Candidatus Omnitrophota bacterium]
MRKILVLSLFFLISSLTQAHAVVQNTYTFDSRITVNAGNWTITGPQGVFLGKVSMYAPIYFMDSKGMAYLYSMNPGITFDSKGMPVVPSGRVKFSLTTSGASAVNIFSLSGSPQPNPYASDSSSQIFVNATTKAIYTGVFSNGSTVNELTSGRKFKVSNVTAGQGGRGGLSVTLTLVPGQYVFYSNIQMVGNNWTITGPQGVFSGKVSMYAPVYFLDSKGAAYLYTMNPAITFNSRGVPVVPSGLVEFSLAVSQASTEVVFSLSGWPQLNPYSSDANSKIFVNSATNAIYAGVFANGSIVNELTSGRQFKVSNAAAGQGGNGGLSVTLTQVTNQYSFSSNIQVAGNNWTITGPQGAFSGKVSMYAPIYFMDSKGVAYLYTMNPAITFNKGMPVVPSGPVNFSLTTSGISATDTFLLTGWPQLNPYSSDANSRVFVNSATKAIYTGVFTNGSLVNELTSGRKFKVSNVAAGQGGNGGLSATLTVVPGQYSFYSNIQVVGNEWTISSLQGVFSGKVTMYAPIYFMDTKGVAYLYSMNPDITFDSKGLPVMPSGLVNFSLTTSGISAVDTFLLTGWPQLNPYASDINSRIFVNVATNAIYTGVFSDGSIVNELTSGRRFKVSKVMGGQGGNGGLSVTLTLVPGQYAFSSYIQVVGSSWTITGPQGVFTGKVSAYAPIYFLDSKGSAYLYSMNPGIAFNSKGMPVVPLVRADFSLLISGASTVNSFSLTGWPQPNPYSSDANSGVFVNSATNAIYAGIFTNGSIVNELTSGSKFRVSNTVAGQGGSGGLSVTLTRI